MKTKVLAFYLPQFHRIKENDEWWGEGFTEWINVKKARSLFKGHYQPKEPLNDFYYDLNNTNTIEWQAKLARKYCVDGFCFYHYWFNGRKLLEKPMENLLYHKEIDIEYCISWANETWSRRWSGEPKEILIDQVYGDENDWELHLKYLLPFFHDTRYIKKDKKPVILIYRAFEIPQCAKMIRYWNVRLIEEGFAGICVIETLNASQKKPVLKEAYGAVEFEPMYTLNSYLSFFRRIYRYCFNHMKLGHIGFRDYLCYKNIVQIILKRNRKRNGQKKIYLGVFPEWDNTARKGKNGLCIKNATLNKFEEFFETQYRFSMQNNLEFLFINAWNEWGEGAYLEPDKKHEYSYLEIIRNGVNKNEEI